MARLALSAGGAALGFAIGGPAGAQWGWMGGSLLGSLVPQNTRGPSIDETGAQTTAEGAPRAIVYGTAAVSGNVIDAGRTRKVERKQSQGKGGQSVTTEGLLRTYAIRVCEGPVGGILVAKKDGKIVYDARDSDFEEDNQKFLDGCRIYLGGEGQLPDPDLEAIHGSGEVPAHRGSVYIVFIDDDVTDRRGSIPQYEFVVAIEIIDKSSPATAIGSYKTASFAESSESLKQTLVVPGSVFNGRSVCLLFMRHMTSPWAQGLAQSTITVKNPSIGASFSINRPIPTGFDWNNNRSGYTLIQCNKLNGGDIEIELSINLVPPSIYPLIYSIAVDVYTPGGEENIYKELSNLNIIPWTDELFGIFVLKNPVDPVRYFYADLEYWGSPFFISETTGKPALLSDIVSDISNRCGLSEDIFDASELEDEVDGLVIASVGYSGADAIGALRAPYFFDRSEWGGLVRYIKRGKDAVATITENDLVDISDDTERQAQIEYPRKLHLSYQSEKINYEAAQATSDRTSPDVRVIGESSMQVPVVLAPDLAAKKVAMLHKVSWAEAGGQVKLSVPDSWIRLVPSDCVLLQLRGTSRRVRIDNIEHAAGVLQLTCNVDRQSAYESSAGYIPLPTPTPPVSTVVGATALAVLDLPALRDDDDAILYYAAVTGARPAWRGAILQRSRDTGASYADVLDMESAAVIGLLAAPIAAASPWYTDRTNVIEVEIIRPGQSIEALTDPQFLARGGGIALRAPGGGWEVAQYRDVEQTGAQRFRLRTLHRGQLNTPATAHEAGAMLVLLDDVRRVTAQSGWLGETLTHRAPSYGMSLESADLQSISYGLNAQREWPVASLSAVISAGSLAASWAPRHRLGTDVAPLASINFQGFRVRISDGSVAIEFDTADTAITRDVSGMSMPLTVTVAALNRITGLGPATTRTITA